MIKVKSLERIAAERDAAKFYREAEQALAAATLVHDPAEVARLEAHADKLLGLYINARNHAAQS